MPNLLPRHRYHRIVALIDRLYAQLDALEAIDTPARKLPLSVAMRGPGSRLIADAARLVPLADNLFREPVYPWQLLASTLGALLAVKSLLEQAKSPPLNKIGETYPRSPEPAYDE